MGKCFSYSSEITALKSMCSRILANWVAKIWKQPKRPLTGEQMKKTQWETHKGIHSVIKRKEIMPCAATWMALASVTLTEVSQSEKDKDCVMLHA